MALQCRYKLARSRPQSASPNSHDYGVQVHLQICSIAASKCISQNSLDYGLQLCSITASECISKLARLWPPSASPNLLYHSLQVHLQTRSITASKCIFKSPLLQPPSASPNSLDYSLQVHVQTCSITASECICQFTPSWCGETLELEGRQPMINSPPHLVWHPKGIRVKEQFCLKEHRKRVSGYEGIPGYDELQKLHGSLNAWQEYMRRRAGKDRVCISYNEMMSIYPGVS